METDVLRSTLDKLAHLVIEPSVLTIHREMEIGVGAYGEVSFATLTTNVTESRTVAVKQLRITQARRRVAIHLARELKVWAAASHPNILPLVGYYLSDDYDRAQLVSPYMSNGNVKDYMETHRSTLVTRIRLVKGLTSGINYLHNCDPPICHGDLKPTNILVNDTTEAVLCDFGLATFVLESGARSGLTTSESVKGSMRYMSPELFTDPAAKHTFKSDIWAWACTAFEILTDLSPYHGIEADGAIVLASARGEPPGSISTLNNLAVDSGTAPHISMGPFKLVISSCWAMSPDDRPVSSDILNRLTAPNENSAGVSVIQDQPQASMSRPTVLRDHRHPNRPRDSSTSSTFTSITRFRLPTSSRPAPSSSSATHSTRNAVPEAQDTTPADKIVSTERRISTIRLSVGPKLGANISSSKMDSNITHAITQGVIGEYLWKYNGQTRHKRFFWIHPETRTLYWTAKSPDATSPKRDSIPKKGSIKAVRSVEDPNPIPTDVTSYSLVVSTKRREIKFTAGNAERHRIWFDALKYLAERPK
ncbi:hypothetical protein FRB90_000534 [Tulasnella sp. 427]|nr:hypothetical protein FRB90_000534 [Tulasnella sp. 427]